MPPMPYAMSIGDVFSTLNAYLEDEANMVSMLKDLRDPTVRRVADLQFFKSQTEARFALAARHIEQEWFGWEPNTGVQDAFDPANPAPTGWWYRWYGNADKITRETVRRALEIALDVPHDSEVIKPNRQWRIMFNWTCGAPLFQGWVVWQCDKDNAENGFVLCSFTTPGNGNPLRATPYAEGSGPNGDHGPAAPGNSGMWIIGDKCTDIVYDAAGGGVPLTGDLPDWTDAYLYTHEPAASDQSGVAVVAPELEAGGVPGSAPPSPAAAP